jgi:hypothetical protein
MAQIEQSIGRSLQRRTPGRKPREQASGQLNGHWK